MTVFSRPSIILNTGYSSNWQIFDKAVSSSLARTGGKGRNKCTDLSTRTADLLCYRKTFVPLPQFHYSWSYFIYTWSHVIFDDIMVVPPTQGPTGSVWGDNWVRRQQPGSWINCCTELLKSAVAPLSANAWAVLTIKFKCPRLTESFSGSNDLPPFTSIYNRHITAHHLFSPKGAGISSMIAIHHCTTLSHLTRLYFTTIFGLWSDLKPRLWLQRFRP